MPRALPRDHATPPAQNGHVGALEELLARGARRDATDEQDKTAAQVALAWGHEAAARLLLPPGLALPGSSSELRDGGAAEGAALPEGAVPLFPPAAPPRAHGKERQSVPQNLRPEKLEL